MKKARKTYAVKVGNAVQYFRTKEAANKFRHHNANKKA